MESKSNDDDDNNSHLSELEVAVQSSGSDDTGENFLRFSNTLDKMKKLPYLKNFDEKKLYLESYKKGEEPLVFKARTNNTQNMNGYIGYHHTYLIDNSDYIKPGCTEATQFTVCRLCLQAAFSAKNPGWQNELEDLKKEEIDDSLPDDEKKRQRRLLYDEGKPLDM